MTRDRNELQQEARQILDRLAFTRYSLSARAVRFQTSNGVVTNPRLKFGACRHPDA
jgi:hypothetical protein